MTQDVHTRIRALVVQASGELPPQVVAAFKKLAQDQRGNPEHAMLRVQFVNGGGILNPVVEHVGDLTHRMSQHAEYNNDGYEAMSDKVEKTLRWLSHPYGFEREHKENLRDNAKYNGISVEEQTQKVNSALDKYAKEHSRLIVYNVAQWTARKAAILVGRRDWSGAIQALKRLQYLLRTPDGWHREAFRYRLASSGKPLPYNK